MIHDHKLTDAESAVLTEAADKVRRRLTSVIEEFVQTSVHNGVRPTLTASGLAQFMAHNVIHSMGICYGMAADDVRKHNHAIIILAERIQRQMVVMVSEFVRTHMDENDLYVSPEDRKQNDAAEKAEYEYDRDKEERSDNSRN